MDLHKNGGAQLYPPFLFEYVVEKEIESYGHLPLRGTVPLPDYPLVGTFGTGLLPPFILTGAEEKKYREWRILLMNCWDAGECAT